MPQIVLGAIMLGLLWAVMTIGVYITYRILGIADLSVEGSITTGAAIAAHCIYIGMNPYLATFLAFLGGMAAGLVTGLLHTKLKIPALLSGILTMIALYSINLRILGKSNLSLLRMDTVYTVFQTSSLVNNPLFTRLNITQLLPATILGIICVFVIITILYWFFGTEIGCAIRATGDNPQMARAQGINTNNMIILGLVLSNGLVALSGALIAQQQSFADIQMGIGSIVIGLASVIIGEVLFVKRSFYSRLVSLALGAITYRLIIAFVLKLGMPANDLKLFTAITVAIALALPTFKSYLRPLTKSMKGGASGAIDKRSL
ncbi:MAG: ABC transporter permease [Firmicutes bacterium]|nr:ABC transporter permease [Bacillota bacterium]